MRKKLFRNAYFFLFLGVSTIYGMLIPFLNYKGFNPLETGTLISIFTLSGISSQFLAGFLCDKFKTIKKILLPLLIATAISGTLSILFDISIYFYVFFILLGFAGSVLASLMDSFVLESDESIKSCFGQLKSFASIGWALGVLITGFIVSRFGYNFISIMFLSSLCISIYCIAKLKDVTKNSCNSITFKPIIINTKYDVLIIVLLIICICFRGYYQLVPYTIDNLGGNTSSIGIYYFIGSISEIIMLSYSMKIMHKISPDKLLIISPIALLLQLLILYFSKSVLLIFLSATLQIFTYPIIIMVGRIMVDRVSPLELRTTSQLIGFAIYNSFAVIIASFLVGFLVDYYNIYYGILCILALAVISIIMCLFFDFKTIDKTL